jgi:hypothetical protein
LLAAQDLDPLASWAPKLLGVVLGDTEHLRPLDDPAVEARVE